MNVALSPARGSAHAAASRTRGLPALAAALLAAMPSDATAATGPAAPAETTLSSFSRSSPDPDCVKHLTKARDRVRTHWSFFVMKTNAFDLDGAVTRLTPDAQAAASADDCADVLRRFMASLGDGHAALVAYPGATPRSTPDGIALRSFRESALSTGAGKQKERLYVIHADEAAGVDALLLGAEVVAIDGRAARDAVDHARERTPSSTPWGRAYWADEGLLVGPAGSTVTLSVRQGGETRDVTLTRPPRPSSDKERKAFWKAYDDTVTLVTWTREEDDVGRIAYASFASERGLREFEGALEALRDTRGLVIDLRGNGGGQIAVLEKLLGRFGAKGFDVGRFIVRNPGSEGVVSDFTPWKVKKRGWTYEGPMVLLVDAGCFSACEMFASTLKDAKRARVVGPTATGGGSASPLTDNLSSGWEGVTISMSIFVVTRPNGAHLESKGVTPHVTVDAKLKDYMEGRDPVLERGLAELRGMIAGGEGVAAGGE